MFYEVAFSNHMAHTLKCAKGCETEIIFRDVYTLKGDRMRAKKAVEITRNQIENIW